MPTYADVCRRKRALQSDPDHSHVLCSYGLMRHVTSVKKKKGPSATSV
jgi:hypothetical protein